MTLASLPGIPYASLPRAASAAGPLFWPPRLVVIHDTSNTASAAAEASYAANRGDVQANWTSAHFYVDPAGPLGSCPLDVQAWAAYSYANAHGWHIEMCGMNAGAPGAVPRATVALTARLVAQLCDLAGIPKTHLGPADVAAGKAGITGHWDITQGLHVGTHDDPGPAFDWVGFIATVNSQGDDMAQLTDQQTANLLAAVDVIGAAALGWEQTWDKKPIEFMKTLHSMSALLTGTIVPQLAAALAAHPAPGTGTDAAAIEQALRDVLPTIRLSAS